MHSLPMDDHTNLPPGEQPVDLKAQAELITEVEATLAHDSARLRMNLLFLTFSSRSMEQEYITDCAKRRWPVLIFVFCFDVLSFILRTAAKLLHPTPPSDVAHEMAPQMLNMAVLYALVGVINWRSRRGSSMAARQEEVVLCALMDAAVTFLLSSLTRDNAHDYVLVSYFLITTTTFLSVRWHVGAALLSIPVLLALGQTCNALPDWAPGPPASILPKDAVVHIVMAWGVGALMAYIVESYRRQVFANHKLTLLAAHKELLESRMREQMQRQLAEAQAQAAARALCVAQEKAANEAKSEFMSLMCHEVRTPLNGALASVEMLLETELEEEQRDLANTIRVSGSILLSTVSNFLDYFKLEAGKRLDIVQREVDMYQLVADVHCIIEAMIGRGTELRLLPPDLNGAPQTILGDMDRLCGILLNLYTNAAKFTKRGYISLRVRVVQGQHTPDPTYVDSLHTLCASPAHSPPHPRSPTARTAAANPLLPSNDPGIPTSITTSIATNVHTSITTSITTSMTPPATPSTTDTIEAASTLTGPVSPGPASPTMGPGSPHSRASSCCSGMCSADDSQWHTVVVGNNQVGVGDVGVHHVPQQDVGLQHKEHPAPQSQWLLFELSDTGTGIAPASLASLFKQYEQGMEVDLQRPRRRGGTGLGLSICSKQVDVLGGQDPAGPTHSTAHGVPPSPDQPCMQLPIDTPQKPTLQKPTLQNPTLQKPTPPQYTIPPRRSLDWRTAIDTTTLQGRRVLLAEDNLINQTVARKMLTSLGLACVVASNGAEAVAAVKRTMPGGSTSVGAQGEGGGAKDPPYDCILMDMMMPVMNGVEATVALRACGATLPIIAMTANASDADRDECWAAGMDGFLSKPVLKEQLAAALAAALAGHRHFSDLTMPRI